MKKITFVTSNIRKLSEAKEACEPLNIAVEQETIEIDEIQNHDPLRITEHKVSQAFSTIKKPLVVNDASWRIPALGGFPGGYMKDVAEWFEPEDFINLLTHKENRQIVLLECIFYKDKNLTKSFLREFPGEISEVPRGESGNSMEKVVILNGRTIAEHRDQGKLAFAAKDFIWHDFAEWYSNNNT